MLTVVTGPPCGGKTTYARQHAMPGDIVIDFDALAQALGCAESHGYGHKDPVWVVTVAARAAAIDAAIDQHERGARVWVVDCSPTLERRRQYAAAGAATVTVTASREELHARADADGRPARWHARIDQWLDQPTADPAPRGRTRW